MQTGKFIEINSQRRAHVVEMPASSYRPSPPSTRVRAQTEPDRQLVEIPEPPKTEHTLRSVPEPPKAAPEMAKKKRKEKASAEQREIALARVRALIKAGKTRLAALGKVAKELGYSTSALNKWMVDAGNRTRAERTDRVVETKLANMPAPGPQLNGLDLFLDIIELCERAKKGLTKSQRVRLRAALNERLS